MSEVWVVVANVSGDRVLRHGARVVVLRGYGCMDSVEVSGISRGGRRVRKHVASWKLTQHRAGFCPPSLASEVWPGWAWDSGPRRAGLLRESARDEGW